MLKKTVQAAAAMALAFFIANPVLISAAQPLSFEAVSIHPLAPPFRALRTMKISGTLLTLEGYNLPWLVEDAFGIKGYQVSTDSVPRSALNVLYRIEARCGGPSAPPEAERRAMLQTLLADRFHLAAHRELRKMPVYALVVDKHGPSLQTAHGSNECSSRIGPVRPNDRNYRYRYTNCTLDPLIDALSADRPILNQTGLTGRYDIEIFATPEFILGDRSEPGDIRFLDAVRKLGLRLEPRNAPTEVIVIDHVDSTPTPN
jgi:uncharacterized protein (TIGR03435 family)